MATISLPVYSFRHLETPFKAQDKRNAIAVAAVKDIPDFEGWREVNPRKVNTKNHVAKEIQETLVADNDFFFINRGLVLTVDRYEFSQKDSVLHLYLTDREIHGLLDGGHTYEIIMNNRDTSIDAGLDQYVKIEILTGFPHDDAVRIVEGRNTSNQVKDKSIANLNKAFQRLKATIEDTPYSDKVSYVENDDKPIDIRELISFLYIFAESDPQIQPIAAYQAKAACLDDFIADFENKDAPGAKYQPVYAIAKDIFALWDQIHLQLPELYNRSRGGGRFARLSGVSGTKDGDILTDLYFIWSGSTFKIPAAMKYPILGAMRAFVEKNPHTGDLQWGEGINPFDMLVPSSGLGQQMAEKVGASIRETRNPSKTGRDKSLWENCYQAARIKYLERKANLAGN